MVTIVDAQAARDAAHADWVAAGSPRTGDHPAWIAAQAAVRALAEAKRAAAQAAKDPLRLAAVVAAAVERQQATARAVRHDAALRAAERLYMQAQEYPRCGQDWPANDAEIAAQRRLDEHFGGDWS